MNNITMNKVESMIMKSTGLEQIYESDVKNTNLEFTTLDSEEIYNQKPHPIHYFICDDGTLTLELPHFDAKKGEFFTLKASPWLERVNEKTLERIAKEYQKARKKAEVYEKILDSQKIRGLMAKMKTWS